MAAFVTFEDVSKVYHSGEIEIRAVDHISFTIEKGEFCVIVGPSGAGKTTVLNMLGGMDACSGGTITVDGTRVSGFNARQLTTYRRHDIGFVFQFYNLVGNLTALENVELAAQICKDPLDAATVLNEVGLSARANNFPGQLSGGEQQRVAIARALVNNPKVLLLDEPLGALDYQLRKNLQLELKNLQRGLGLTFIYVTHDQEEALTMSDRIVVMNKGVIEQDDNPDNIYHYPSTKFVAKFIGESNFFDTETETLALRPEKLNLCEEAESEDKAAAHPEPAFYGTVVDVVFYGTIDKVFVRLDNSNQTVVAYQYFDDVKRWTPDERVGIWWYERDEVKVQR